MESGYLSPWLLPDRHPAAQPQERCGGCSQGGMTPAGRPSRWSPGKRRLLMTLRSKSAVVTGSTSGIGLAIARALAKDGANVLVNGFGEPGEIERARREIEAEFGVKTA